MTPDEAKVFSALDNPEWEWRTVDGIAKETGLDAKEVFETLIRHSDLVKIAQHLDRGTLFQLKERTTPFHEGTIERVLDYLTAGRAKRFA